MLSGRRAFYGQTAVSTMAAILHKDPDPLDAPAELDAVIRRCLKKSPADRFQNASELREALAALNLSAPKKRPSVAILPFTNMSGDKENEYFSDGLAEEIISALTRLPGLKVAARTSAFAFKGRSEDIRKIGEVLGVDHVLEGSVRKSGNRVRITAQLVAIAEGSHLWSERYDREMSDVFAIQDEISQAIVEVLKVKLGGDEGRRIVTRRTANVAAWQAWMEGQYHRLQMTPAGLVEGLRHFERAIALDPGFAAPHAGLAECYLYQALYAAVPAAEAIPKAMAAAERSIALDPSAAEGYMARGLLGGACNHDWASAERDFARALEINPDSPLTNYRMGWWVRMPQGRLGDALALCRRAVELDPLSHLTRGVEALTLSIAGRCEEAIERARSGMPLVSNSFMGPFLLGSALVNCGLVEEALHAFTRGLAAQSGNLWLLTSQAMTYSIQGRQSEVRRIVDHVASLSANRPIPHLVKACLESALGNDAAARAALDRAVGEREIWTVAFVRQPWMCKLMPPGAAADALRKMNLQPAIERSDNAI